MIAAIVAVDMNWGIGYNGELLERIPQDLKRFKELTNNKWVIMGRKTWDSLPKKPLFDRTNAVITHNSVLGDKNKDAIFLSLEEMKLILQQQRDADFFVIGGEQIYQEFLPYCDRIYVTKIYCEHDKVDTYFPNIDTLDEWVLIHMSEMFEHNGIKYQFCEYNSIFDL